MWCFFFFFFSIPKFPRLFKHLSRHTTVLVLEYPHTSPKTAQNSQRWLKRSRIVSSKICSFLHLVSYLHSSPRGQFISCTKTRAILSAMHLLKRWPAYIATVFVLVELFTFLMSAELLKKKKYSRFLHIKMQHQMPPVSWVSTFTIH